MNWIDIGIIALLLYQMAMGYRKGLSRSVLDLVGIAAVVLITFTQFRLVSDLLGDLLSTSSTVIRWFSFLICLGLSMALINGVTGLVGRFIKTASPTWINRMSGLMFGGMRGIIITGMALMLYTSLPFPTPFKSQFTQSALAPSAASVIPMVYDAVALRIRPDSRPFTDQFNDYFRSGKAADRTFITASGKDFGRLLRRIFSDPQGMGD